MNEQQHLEEVIGRFLQNTRENEEISKEEAIYLKRRIRPAMEYLIVQENIDGMKKMADRGWFGEQELNGFLSRAGELKKWDAVAGVNVTLGLPIIRASVDHGTGEGHAGDGSANELSLVNAMDYAIRMANAKAEKEEN